MSTRYSVFEAIPARVVLALLLLAASLGKIAQAGDSIESSGDILRAAIPAAAFAMTFAKDDRQGRRQFYKSFGANVAATLVLKELIDKERPDGSDDDALPSGHTSTAFQGAAFLHRRYGFGTAWPAWVLAAYTGWTRLDADEHDEADVIAGAALGIASSMLFVERFERIDVAFFGGDAVGIRINGRF